MTTKKEIRSFKALAIVSNNDTGNLIKRLIKENAELKAAAITKKNIDDLVVLAGESIIEYFIKNPNLTKNINLPGIYNNPNWADTFN